MTYISSQIIDTVAIRNAKYVENSQTFDNFNGKIVIRIMMGKSALDYDREYVFRVHESWVMTVCRRCRVIHSGESMPEIISVYSYVGGGEGDVLTSSVNELYLSVGFIRGFFLLPFVASLVPLYYLDLSSHRNLFLFRGISHSLRSFLLCDRQEFERYTKSALSKLAHSTFWAPGIIHEPAEKPTRDESWWY